MGSVNSSDNAFEGCAHAYASDDKYTQFLTKNAEPEEFSFGYTLLCF